jgi:hypothetical protein
VSEVENSRGELSADVDTFVDEFLSSLPTYDDAEDSDVLAEGGRHDTTDTTPTLRRSLFDNGIEETPPAVRMATNEAAAALTHLAAFPANYGTVENRFTNQDPELNDEGYDSEGNLPHFANPDIEDDAELYNEECIGGPGGGVEMVLSPAAAPVAIDVMKLNVVMLRAELKKRGRSTFGNKAAMQQRLNEAIALNVPVSESAGNINRDESMMGLDVTAKWELLNRCENPMPEPTNADGSLRPPTEMNDTINPKFGFIETFDRIPFTGTTEKMRYVRPEGRSVNRSRKEKRKRKQSQPRQSRPVAEVLPRKLGGPNTDFLHRYGLSETSHPMDWFTAFMPLTPNDNKEDASVPNVKGDRRTKFAVSNWTAYSNTKAMLAGAGEPGHIFAGKHRPFSNKDIVQMLGVYIIDGLAPSPQLTQKMQPQSKSPTHGNDRIAAALGPGYQQKHRSFRHFFATQDPLMVPPPKEKCPNVKVDEFFRWLRYIWKEAWLLGEGFSIDEQTTKCQGKCEYKTRCGKFKRLGDGLQGDCIADDGYTWDFYFRNEPIDPNLLAMGFCPMHCRLLYMFKNLRESGHRCKMDNLFNSVKLARAAYCLPNPVLVHGVLRKSGRGCPPCVVQQDKTGKAADQARGTVKAAVLKDDSQSSNLVVASCYDQKPFYMISHSCESVTWVPVTKPVWSSALQKNVDLTFLRFNLSDDYNYEMNDNDVADQLRLVYRIMRFQRNVKWWWALFLWGYEVSLVNAYVSYKRYCELKGVPVKWTHHDWNEAIGYAHIDPDEYWLRRKSPPKTSVSRADPQKRTQRIDSLALSPTRGRLQHRLDGHNHMPVVPVNRQMCCQLHRWAYKEFNPDEKDNGKPKGSRVGVMRCRECNVHLCLSCWEIFHSKERLRLEIPRILNAEE